MVANVSEIILFCLRGKLQKCYSLEDKNLKNKYVRRFKSSGMTPYRVVYSYGSVFTNRNGVTTPKYLLTVVTGTRITNLSEMCLVVCWAHYREIEISAAVDFLWPRFATGK